MGMQTLVIDPSMHRATIAQRHVNFVYAAALRQVRNAHLAEDVTQAVFLILAKKKVPMDSEAFLTGWLYRTTRYAAANALKLQRRRQYHEMRTLTTRQTANHRGDHPSHTVEWEELSSVIDDAMTRLAQRDREPLLLRCFQDQSLREVGLALGISEDAAKKRVARGIERLRELLVGRGIVLSAAGLTSAISVNAIHAAPAALSAAVISTTPAAHAMAIAKATLSSMLWPTVVNVVMVLAIGVVAGSGISVLMPPEPTAPSSIVSTQPTSNQAAQTTQPAALLTTQPTTRPSAAHLIRAAHASEQWLDRVDNFSVKFTERWQHSERGIARNREQIIKNNPGAALDPQTNAALRPQIDGKLEILFDKKRFYHRHEWVGDFVSILAIDGKEVYHFQQKTGEADRLGIQFVYPQMQMQNLLHTGDWPHRQLQAVEWAPPQKEESNVGLPDEFVLMGRENYRGTDCYVVQRQGQPDRWYISADKQRLHGRKLVMLKADPDNDPTLLEVARFFGQKDLDTASAKRWLESLNAADRARVDAEYRERAPHWIEHWTEDYKEVAPGCWIPMTRGYCMYSGTQGDHWPDIVREYKVVEVKMNEPGLLDAVFPLEVPEGTPVTDQTYDPALQYQYRKNMSGAERLRILGESKKLDPPDTDPIESAP
jgi:RNA polymerase sigma factor (sigma-70 family)